MQVEKPNDLFVYPGRTRGTHLKNSVSFLNYDPYKVNIVSEPPVCGGIDIKTQNIFLIVAYTQIYANSK